MKPMIHRSLALLISAFFIHSTYAQTAYSLHKLEQGETLSTLAKNYHTTVGDIMRLNSMNAQSKLQPGAQIKIPADGAAVPAQKPMATSAPVVTKAAAASATPKTHVVATGETLYRISQMYKIPVDQLKAINNLPDGSVKVGQTILLSADASTAAQPVKAAAEQAAAASKETPKAAPPKETAAPAQQPKETSPVKPPVVTSSAPVQSQPAATTPTANMAKQEVIVQDNSGAFTNNYPSASNAPKEGFFTALYGKDTNSKGREQVKDGSAMTFKSASGWADKKYYVLMNDAPTGSIVKIKNGRNELYAKVLWNLSDMKENEGLAFRISTAAAAALGITDQKFDLKVSYYE